MSKSNEYSINGDISIKSIISNEANQQYMGFILTNFPQNVDLTFQVNILSPVALRLNAFQNVNDTWANNSVNIPSGETLANITVSINENVKSLWLRLDGVNIAVDTVFYIDNLSLTVD